MPIAKVWQTIIATNAGKLRSVKYNMFLCPEQISEIWATAELQTRDDEGSEDDMRVV